MRCLFCSEDLAGMVAMSIGRVVLAHGRCVYPPVPNSVDGRRAGLGPAAQQLWPHSVGPRASPHSQN